jgi:hypothetical protein
MVTKHQKELKIIAFKNALKANGFEINRFGHYVRKSNIFKKTIKVEIRKTNIRLFADKYKVFSEPIVNTNVEVFIEKVQFYINKY